MKPQLPYAEKLLPYLRRLDESRVYSNFGELNAEYQDRLGELFGAPCVTGASATSLITATLMAYDLPKGSLVAMPSYTFPATAAAVVNAGMVPYFVDVESDGVIDVRGANSSCRAIIVVAPYGKYPGGWDEFSKQHNIPVIIDAAAAFDVYSTTFKPKNCPVIISTHSTKCFATGEGGVVFSRNDELLERIRRISNFGLTPDRRIEYTGLNCKFSEYHAAVGLAELDGWNVKRELLISKAKKYGIDYAVTLVPVRGQGVMRKYGCHIHDAYAGYPRTELPVTNELIENVGAIMIGID